VGMKGAICLSAVLLMLLKGRSGVPGLLSDACGWLMSTM
jgi:hypothetical protein